MFGDHGGVVSEADYLIHLGKHRLSSADENTLELKVARATLHKNYKQLTLANDIGLLKLNRNVDFSKYIQPICLWDESPNDMVSRQTGYVVGWGFTETQDEPVEVLREAQMPIIETAQCLEVSRDSFGQFLSSTNYCAGYKNGTSVCSGDSGSGMYINLNGLWKIRGIVSLGAKPKDGATCNFDDYALFTNVLMFIDWIKEIIHE